MSKTIEGTRLVIKVDSAAVGVLGDLVDRLMEGGALNSLDNVSAEVEQFTVEVCEACEAEITADNVETQCEDCGGAACWYCDTVDFLCKACAEKRDA